VINAASVDILIVDDDFDFRQTCVRWFKRKGFNVDEAASGQEALRRCEERHFHVAIVDMSMPELSGLELLDRLKRASIDTEVMILTGQATVETAVEAMKLGACDYLKKPFPLVELEQRCRIACERGHIRKENLQLKAVLERSRPRTEMIGESPQLKNIFRMIERVARSDSAVLIEGESGTGKELVARAIQQNSSRADKHFVVVDCAALSESLAESELFGHVEGAFTGASKMKPGLFEVADGGTLFIDEIGELPLTVQPKLLRALEDGWMRRVGSNKERRVDVRVLAATNRNLSEEVEAGRFRDDLYYRINVISIALPPLRDREGDIRILVDHFLGAGWELDSEARRALESFDWPGNVRQLINAVERAKIMSHDRTILPEDLPEEVFATADTKLEPQVSGTQDLETLERAHVEEVMKQENGNKSRAARALGIHRRKLYRLLERYGVG